MRHCLWILVFGAAVCLANVSQAAFELDWDGGDGMWFSHSPFSSGGNWNGQQNVYDLVGRENGHEGHRDSTGPADFLIGGGSKVSYDAYTLSEEFRIMQGSNLTITGGAVWEQKTLDADEVHPQFGQLERWDETYSTLLDPSNLNLDGGTFRRIGATTSDPNDLGSGAMIFGSSLGDDNFGDRDGDADTDGADFLDWQRSTPINSAGGLRKIVGTYGASPNVDRINVNLTNGGSLENEGQLWFVSQQIFPIEINVNISGGSTIKAYGGHDVNPGLASKSIAGADASIVIFRWEESNVGLTIDFTGPGSIMTDEGAINLVSWNAGASSIVAVSYEDLWNAGILTANGGSNGAFADHFSVSGSPGDAVYTLTSTLAPAPNVGAVPEPSSFFLTVFAVLSLAGVLRFRSA